MKKSLALCCIAKNEESNVKRFLESFLPAVDHVYFTDTGSTDRTVEIAKEVGGDKITIRHFEWVNDFAAARNESIKDVPHDYILWADLDDCLSNINEFVRWRDSVMYMADLWIATYDYAQDNTGRSMCSFARERVFRNNKGLKFSYFVHEGLMVNSPGIQVQHVPSWTIKHQRTLEDISKDKGRNLGIFKFHEEKGTKFDARMDYYFGKEYFEGGDIENALKKFSKAITSTELEMHDRILCMQYFCMCLFQKEKFIECVDMAKQGLSLAPTRAEFYVLQGDCYTKLQRVLEAIPCYAAAASCRVQTLQNGAPSVIFSHQNAYGPYPLCQLARCFVHIQNFGEAQKYASEANEKYPSAETKALLDEISRIKNNVLSFRFAKETEDIVFTCLGSSYEWDDAVYAERGVGGSETACIQMAKHIRLKTGRRVIVFNPRKEDYISPDGVEYRKVESIHTYFSMSKPKFHVAWRHNIKLTDARTVTWSHDIYVPGYERLDDYEKYICLSEFHKNYITTIYGVPDHKIYVSRNGIVPELFDPVPKKAKDPNKVVYVSSWDRGLDRCIAVLDLVRLEYPDLKLHVFYGNDSMKKHGGQMAELAVKIEKMIEERPWVINHGNTKQSELPYHYADAALWVYPLNFVESFCISVLETLRCGIFPLVRNFSAITSTLGPYAARGMGKLMDFDAVTVSEQIAWSDAVKSAIKAKAWERIDVGSEGIRWSDVAEEWIKDFSLTTS